MKKQKKILPTEDLPLSKISFCEQEDALTNKMVEWFRKTKKEGSSPEQAIEISNNYYKKHKKPIWL